jgi:hypothetical protein
MKLKDLKKKFQSKFSEMKRIDNGGNATVYSVKNIATNELIALKVLDTTVENFGKKRDRFIIETNKVREIQIEYAGIIPIYEFSLPDANDQNLYWYTMPIAQPINKYFEEKRTILDIVNCIISLANTLADLHAKNIVHRDIKPNNIYYFNGRFCLADFGLVDYPEKENLTKIGEQIGAKATIAPEMKRDSKNADGKKADVYSLAKTLWMLLTNNTYGFEGIYNPTSKLMGLKNYFKDEHLVELNKILVDATQDNPDLRPTMKELSQQLTNYCLIYNDFQKSNLSQWQYVQDSLFKRRIPESAYWKNNQDIVDVMNLIGSMPSLNHMFVPDGGGLDFDYAEIAAEEGCIAIYADESIYIVKPKKLIVENIENDFIWSYFRLDLNQLDAIKTESIYNDAQQLTEYLPGQYISWICGNYGYYEDDKPLPKDYRLVTRILSGSFVFFCKASIYNHIHGTYDARHNKINADEFRNYIELMRLDAFNLGGKDFNKKYNTNPSESEFIDREQIEKTIQQEKEFAQFIKDTFSQLNFIDICKTTNTLSQNTNCLVYTLEINFNEGLLAPRLFLNKDGNMINYPEMSFIRDNKIEGKYIFETFDAIDNAIINIENQLKKLCEEQRIMWHDDIFYFEINLNRKQAPPHIFTKDEIEVVLRKGNDHKNNTLVIDGNGYPQLVEDNEKYYFIDQFPVRHESYCRYNNYTGKYSKLNHLEDEYISSLQGWLMHLQSGGRVYMDYVHRNTNEKELLDEIHKYYKNEE